MNPDIMNLVPRTCICGCNRTWRTLPSSQNQYYSFDDCKRPPTPWILAQRRRAAKARSHGKGWEGPRRPMELMNEIGVARSRRKKK